MDQELSPEEHPFHFIQSFSLGVYITYKVPSFALFFGGRNSLKLDFSEPPAGLKLRVNPPVRCIDDLPICTESQRAWVISPAAVAADTRWNWRYSCRLYCDPRLLNM